MAEITDEGQAEKVLQEVESGIREASGKYRPGKSDLALDYLIDRGKVAISALALLQRERAIPKLVEILRDDDGGFTPELRIAAMDAAAGILRGRKGAVPAEHVEAFYVQLRFMELETCEILARKASGTLASMRRIEELKDVIKEADKKLECNRKFLTYSHIGGILSEARGKALPVQGGRISNPVMASRQ